MHVEVTLAEAKELIIDCFRTRRVPMLYSHAGMGKSHTFKAIADEWNLQLLDERPSAYSPVDANGIPYPNTERTKAKFIPMENFPLEGDPIPEGKDGWLLFLDELPSANSSVIPTLYKLLHDRKVGNAKLHPKVIMAAAGNKLDSNAIVYEMGTAMQSRIIHIFIKSSLKGFINHAIETDFDHRMIGFINYKPNLLNNFTPSHDDYTFACERTWEYMSDFMKLWGKDIPTNKLPLFTGTIGQAAGRELYSFCKVYHKLVSMETILANPEGAEIPTEPMSQWAIASSLAHRISPESAENIMKYLKRMPLQFQFMAMKIAARAEPTIVANPNIAAWISKVSREHS